MFQKVYPSHITVSGSQWAQRAAEWINPAHYSQRTSEISCTERQFTILTFQSLKHIPPLLSSCTRTFWMLTSDARAVIIWEFLHPDMTLWTERDKNGRRSYVRQKKKKKVKARRSERDTTMKTKSKRSFPKEGITGQVTKWLQTKENYPESRVYLRPPVLTSQLECAVYLETAYYDEIMGRARRSPLAHGEVAERKADWRRSCLSRGAFPNGCKSRRKL